MKKSEMWNGCTSIDEAARNVALTIKTDALIKELANSDIYPDLNATDIDRCIRETGCIDFSLADVRFAHAVYGDPMWQGLDESVNKALEEMAAMKPEGRRAFYDEKVRPLLKAREWRQDDIRRGFADFDLEYYADNYEEVA